MLRYCCSIFACETEKLTLLPVPLLLFIDGCLHGGLDLLIPLFGCVFGLKGWEIDHVDGGTVCGAVVLVEELFASGDDHRLDTEVELVGDEFGSGFKREEFLPFGAGTFGEDRDRTVLLVYHLFGIFEQLDQSGFVFPIDADHLPPLEQLAVDWRIEELFFGDPSHVGVFDRFHGDDVDDPLVVEEEEIGIGIAVPFLDDPGTEEAENGAVEGVHDGTLVAGEEVDQRDHPECDDEGDDSCPPVKPNLGKGLHDVSILWCCGT